jgi:hypothetical protein
MCSADGSTYYIGQSSPRTMQWPIAALRGHLRLHLNGLLQRQQGTPDQRGKPHVPPFTATRAAQLALGWTAALATIAAGTPRPDQRVSRCRPIALRQHTDQAPLQRTAPFFSVTI